jgi:cyclopropane fatty-acyl-phospholipid synthase-like methyltransferase
VGTIWFDDSNAEARIVKHITNVLKLERKTDILDLGTGNGHMLSALRSEAKFIGGHLVGVDYSQQSVNLARRILDSEGHTDIKIERWDILHEEIGTWGFSGFDLLIDKGTFDAISLSEDRQDGKRIFEFYAQKITPLIRNGGYLIMTSCNWTESELMKWFQGTNGMPWVKTITQADTV